MAQYCGEYFRTETLYRDKLLKECKVKDFEDLAKRTGVTKTTAKAYIAGQTLCCHTITKIRKALGKPLARAKKSGRKYIRIDRKILNDVLEMCGYRNSKDLIRLGMTKYSSEAIFNDEYVAPRMLRMICRLTGSTPDEIMRSY